MLSLSARYSPLVLALRLSPARRLAVYLSDSDVARARLDNALHEHSAVRLAERAAAEAVRRTPAYAGRSAD